jgi:hypothetical protein
MKYWRVAVEYIDTDEPDPRIVADSHSISDLMMEQVTHEIGPEGIVAGVATVLYRNVRQRR